MARNKRCMSDAQKASFDPIQAVLVISVKTPSAMLIATTCDELRPLALSADAAAGVASIDFRSDCISSLVVCAMMLSIFERTAGCRSLMSTTSMLCMPVLDSAGGVVSDCGGAPCACTKAGVPRRQTVATMTDAVKMRMVIPFCAEKPRNSAMKSQKIDTHEIWQVSDSHVAIR